MHTNIWQTDTTIHVLHIHMLHAQGSEYGDEVGWDLVCSVNFAHFLC